MGRRLLSLVVAALVGGLFGVAAFDVGRSVRYDGTYLCTHSMVHDILHPPRAADGTRPSVLDPASPCHRQARVHVIVWIGLFVAVALVLVLAVKVDDRRMHRPPDL